MKMNGFSQITVFIHGENEAEKTPVQTRKGAKSEQSEI
jgi:hypothetical protein